jgi:hypothetical protein
VTEQDIRRIDKALERFRAGEAELHTDDGSRLFSDEEHDRRYQALLAEFDRAKDRVVTDADKAIEEAERTLVLEHRDLADNLTNEELTRANAKKAYVEDDVRNVTLETLVKRVKAAQASGDRPTQFLYARTLQNRIETEYASDVTQENAWALRELEALAADLTRTIRGPEAERELSKARETIDAAHGLKLHAVAARCEADGSGERNRVQSAAAYRENF